jgi:hypothetical protein
MRPMTRMDHGAIVFAIEREELSGRGARRDLMRNQLEMGIDGPGLSQPEDRMRRL